jgi:tetratricopeptide (TPR) repeat protein
MATASPQIAHIYNPANMTPQELVDNFVIRKNEFRRLFDALKNAPMERPEQHYIVVGPRGSGKSTLLQRLHYEVQHDPELRSRVVSILFPEEQYNILTLDGLWESVIEALDHEPGFAGVYDAFEAGLPDGDSEEYAFECLVRILQARGKKVILFLENIGDLLEKFTEQEHQRFRERLLTCADIRIIGGSAVVLEHTYRYDRPLFDFFQFEYLRELTKKEVYALLTNLARLHREEHVTRILREQPERVEILRRLTGGIPRTIVLLFEIFAEEAQGDSYKDLMQVLDRVTPLYKHRMDDLTPQRQKIMDTVAMNWDAVTLPEIAAKLRLDQDDASANTAFITDFEDLIKNSLIQRVPESVPDPLYQIAERFFNIWYLMRCGKRIGKNRVLWFVRFLEAWCSPQDLQNRDLKHLESLEQPNIDLQYALHLTKALSYTCLDTELQHSLIQKTRDLLNNNDKSLLEELSPSDKELYASASDAYDAGKFDHVIGLLHQVQNPSALTMLLLGKAYHQQKDDAKADRYVQAAIEADLDNADVLGDYAIILEERKDYNQSEKFYRRAIEIVPNNALILGNLADFLENHRQDYDQAEKFYILAIEANPNHARNLSWYAYFLENKRTNYDQAEQFYRQAINADPNYAWNLGRYAHFLETVRDDDAQAEQFYHQAINAGPENASTHFLFSIFLETKRQDYDQAEQFYRRAIEIVPNNAWSLGRYAYFLETVRDDDAQAEQFYRQAINADPNHAWNLGNFAYFLENKRTNYDQAEQFYRQAINADPNHAWNLGRYAYFTVTRRGDYVEAEKIYINAIKNGNIIALNLLVEMYFVLNMNKEKALEYSTRLAKCTLESTSLFVHAMILLWNDYTAQSLMVVREAFQFNIGIELPIAARNYLLMLIASQRYEEAQALFSDSNLNLRDRYLPVYYALVTFMKGKRSQEYRRMGSELKETVEELAELIKRWRQTYFPDILG